MKAALCFVVLLSSVLAGFGFSARLSLRERTLEDVIAMFFEAKQKMAYASMRLCEVFADNPMGFAFEDQRPFDEQWHEYVARYRRLLKKEDIRLLEQYADEAGGSDLSSELRRLELYSGLLKDRLEDARRQTERKSKLYKTLGFCAGLLAAIIMI